MNRIYDYETCGTACDGYPERGLMALYSTNTARTLGRECGADRWRTELAAGTRTVISTNEKRGVQKAPGETGSAYFSEREEHAESPAKRTQKDVRRRQFSESSGGTIGIRKERGSK